MSAFIGLTPCMSFITPDASLAYYTHTSYPPVQTEACTGPMCEGGSWSDLKDPLTEWRVPLNVILRIEPTSHRLMQVPS